MTRLLAVGIVVFVAVSHLSSESSPAAAQHLTIEVPGFPPLGVVEIIRDHVAGGATTNVFTVPGGQTLVITDLVISNDNSFIACCQRVLRGANAATALITVAPQSAFSSTFATGIIFGPGQVVAIQNGAVSSTNFYLRGYLVSSP